MKTAILIAALLGGAFVYWIGSMYPEVPRAQCATVNPIANTVAWDYGTGTRTVVYTDRGDYIDYDGFDVPGFARDLVENAKGTPIRSSCSPAGTPAAIAKARGRGFTCWNEPPRGDWYCAQNPRGNPYPMGVDSQ